ncbi:trans-aconitate 2-methyltransferase-like [Ptychodera flava]|uniref:trans-aconitate 2-methyltransferase-like n=1 Tax=Ptychodera flava TaxID=63121 RepID=UPI00396A72DB
MDPSKEAADIYENVVRKGQLDGAWGFLSKAVTWTQDDVVLDVGCGTGSFTKLIPERGGVKSIIGYDISPEFIETAKRENYIEGKTFYHVADGEDSNTFPPEWKNAFDKAVCFAVFRFIRNKKAFLENVSDCLKPGGKFIFRFQHRNVEGTMTALFKRLNEHPKWKGQLQGYKFADDLYYKGSADELRQLMTECGFCDAKVQEKLMSFYANLDEAGHKAYIQVQTPHLKHIPEDKKAEFIDDAYEILKDIAPRNDDGKLVWQGPTMIVIATK